MPTTILPNAAPADSAPATTAYQRSVYRDAMEASVQSYEPPKIDPNFQFRSPLRHGWLQPYLYKIETALWGRWDHWIRTISANSVLPEPIPQIKWDEFSSHAQVARKSIERALNSISPYSDWTRWGNWTNFEYFIEFILFGFGHPAHKTLPEPPCKGAAERLYQSLDLGPLLVAPHDYLGAILAANAHGRHIGFFPTPMHISCMMAQMVMCRKDEDPTRDNRLATTLDPALGTGRNLLTASNYSYNLFGQDINAMVLKVTLVNGFLYAPWLVRPLKTLSPRVAEYLDPRRAKEFSDTIAEAAATDLKVCNVTDWGQTEFDLGNFEAVAPLKIRRCKNPKDDPYVTGRSASLNPTMFSL